MKGIAPKTILFQKPTLPYQKEGLSRSSSTLLKMTNYKNPQNFDPDNFLPENEPNKFAHMIFGQGPRACPDKMLKLSLNFNVVPL